MDQQDAFTNVATVLVAFATRYGSTEEVAQAISNSLQGNGFTVEVCNARDVRHLEGYSAVVLGAPFYLGTWHKDAQRFLMRFEHQLKDLPIAIFALGPVTLGENDSSESREQLTSELEKYPWLKPVSAEMFGGRYDPAKLSFAHRLLTALPASPLHGLPGNDLRDWNAIDGWTTTLLAAFQPAAQR